MPEKEKNNNAVLRSGAGSRRTSDADIHTQYTAEVRVRGVFRQTSRCGGVLDIYNRRIFYSRSVYRSGGGVGKAVGKVRQMYL